LEYVAFVIMYHVLRYGLFAFMYRVLVYKWRVCILVVCSDNGGGL